jgi:hypothetical protein
MDGAKTKIVGYGIKKGKQLATESQSTEKHSIHFHDVEFNDDIPILRRNQLLSRLVLTRSNWRLCMHARARRRHPPQAEDSPLPVINPPMTYFPL